MAARSDVVREYEAATHALRVDATNLVRAGFFLGIEPLRFIVRTLCWAWHGAPLDAETLHVLAADMHSLRVTPASMGGGDGLEAELAKLLTLAATAMELPPDADKGPMIASELLRLTALRRAASTELRARMPSTPGHCVGTERGVPVTVMVLSAKKVVAVIDVCDPKQGSGWRREALSLKGPTWASEDGLVRVPSHELARGLESRLRDHWTHYDDGTPKRYTRAADGLVYTAERYPEAGNAYKMRPEGAGRVRPISGSLLMDSEWALVPRAPSPA